MLCAGLAALLSVAAPAYAADFPTKPIRIVVPFGAGGGLDAAVRVLAQGMQARIGQPVVVENRTGSSGTIAANHVRAAEPDGHTLLAATTNLLSFPRSVVPGMNYDASTDFAPVGLLYEAPLVIVVNSKSPIRTLADLVDTARRNPGKLSFGSYGVATTTHFCMEDLKRRARVSLIHIPYRGIPTIDLVGGHFDVGCDTVPPVMEHVNAGTLRLLAVTTPQRSRFAPGVPTVSELGYPGFQVSTWSAIVAPKGTPPAVLRSLNETIRAVLDSPQFRARTDALAYEPRPTSPEQLAEFIRTERDRWQKLVTDANIRLD
jgi:tripartite-type tricarboxylate transporter receptor subunit TctC